jgi:glycerate kinase
VARILLAPDSFKGSATSKDVANAVAKGWAAVRPSDSISTIAFGDGGEGTLDCIAGAVADTQKIEVMAQGADGREGNTYWLLVNGDTAVIEMAAICGITTVEKLDALGAHSFGLGQVIADALNHPRLREILVAVGGSASTDAGVGALIALGCKAIDGEGRDIALGGRGLNSLARMEKAKLREPVRGIKVLVDVQSPMTGVDGAAYVYGPQKGASAGDVEVLDAGLKNFLAVVGAQDRAGYGAAGGVSGGLTTVLGAQIVSGVETLAQISGLLEKLDQVDCVITGEGAFDNQSFRGKVVGYVLEQAKVRGVAAMVVCGVNKNGLDNQVISLVEIAPSVDDAIKSPAKWLEVAGQQLAERFGAIVEG